MSELRLPACVQLHTDPSARVVANRLAATVAERLRQALAQQPRASLAVSGGSTPKPFFHALSQAELDWSRVDIVLADERWVDEGDPASNTRLVRESLLTGLAEAARYVPLKQPGDTPAQGLAAVEQALAGLAWPLEVLVLGMGNDGHTASLFPDAPELADALRDPPPGKVAALSPPSQAQLRVTLVYTVLKQAKYAALHLKGDDKIATLATACAQIEDISAMPIRGFLKPGLQIFWSP